MEPKAILLPLATLALWTLLVLRLIPYRRFRAVAAGQVDVEDFCYGASDRVPGAVRLPNRHLMNLLELPMRLYVAGLLLDLLAAVDTLAVILAWTYVALRLAHSIIHLSYNKVLHRLACSPSATSC
jgi:hypothetical protein